MREIPLTHDKSTMVDDCDFPIVSSYDWFAVRGSNTWYAATTRFGRDVYLHRFLMGMPKGLEVDHVNENGLDNQRLNLRVATKRQNAQHRKWLHGAKTSKYTGVCWDKTRSRWRVTINAGQIKPNGHAKQQHVGVFRDEVQAARAYDAVAILLFGDFAMVNFPQEKK